MLGATLSAPLVDLEHDELQPVSVICERRTGKRAPPQKVWRWRLKGSHGARLECYLVNGVWCTTDRAFADFIRRQTANANAASVATESTERTPATARKLKAAGLI
jgi:hypothetical protein